MTTLRRLVTAATVGLVLAAAVVLLVPREPALTSQNPGRDTAAVAAADRFLDTYADQDGRVVRRDQGGDTVSEGQAYGMLLAVAVGDEQRFGAIWAWTQDNMRRDDGLLSWQWRDGALVDAESAADADLDAARALVLAGDRFDDDALAADGRAMAQAVLDHETVQTPLGLVLTAGTWAASAPWAVNPSYFSPVAATQLAQATGDPRWVQLAAGGTAVTEALLDQQPLPPDWAQVTDSGEVRATPGPDGQGPRFSLDAARTLVRTAESCAAVHRTVASTSGAELDAPTDELRGVYDLAGSPQVDWRHPLVLTAAAAAAAAQDRPEELADRLDAAEQLDAEVPGYYGSAWVALGRVMLQTQLLGSCGTAATSDAPTGIAASVPTLSGPTLSGPQPIPQRAEVSPDRVRIPAIGVDTSDLEDLARDTGTGELLPPVDFARAGWYVDGPVPGDAGPSVIAGHVDDRSGPKVFYRLRELVSGDEVQVTRSDGREVTFRVDGVEQYPKGEFPTAAVYGPQPGSSLRLITCGGVFDDAERSYRDNIVVYASEVTPPG